ncbi:hypothetical protein FGG08_007415 [Glutinoglossum americanum]|uniref:Dystroglycan-type cadherin-like domain-containing protein n=1 Tax=Glutinoglossum americanum TaxID=1670608 RepID=A0A9P8I5D1_9PEZI|nr:hypothetical protein FGG08_007415 [Glutinoglossum americanum]
MLAAAIFLPLVTLVEAVPRIALPINSQVPPVARVAEPFNFGFPASTFSSDMPSLNYTLTDAPPWLLFDGGNRIFSGTPSRGDVGPAVFQLIATDASGSANMDVTFIVSPEPSPQLEKPLSDQLRTLVPVSQSSSVMLYPLVPFSFAFSEDTFASTGAILTYYAVSADHTPLPSWINFDSSSLKFSGVTPPWTSLTAPPQSFDVQLIASDVLGFAGATAGFSLVVSDHMLVFSNGYDTLNATRGVPIVIADLRSRLLLDGRPVNDVDLKTAKADVPSWLNFDSRKLVLRGTPPPGVSSQVVNVSVTDVYGDVATDTIRIRISSALFESSIGNLTATAGERFNYSINRAVFKDPDVAVKADISPSTSWLTFDSGGLRFEGNVPRDAVSSDIKVNLTATSKSSSLSDFELFAIKVENADARTASAARSSVMTPEASQTKVSKHTATSKPDSDNAGDRRGKLAALIIVPCLLFIAALAGVIFWWRRRRGKDDQDKTRQSPVISRPLEIIEDPWPTAEKVRSFDYETPRRAPFLGTLSVMWRSSTDFQNSNYQRAKDWPVSEDALGDSQSREIVDSREQTMEFARPPRGDSITLDSTANFSFGTPAGLGRPERPKRPDEPLDAISPIKRNSQNFGSYSNGNRDSLLGRRLSGVGHGSGLYGPAGHGVPKRSWRRTGSSRNWETIRSSDISAATESTDMLLNGFPSIRVVTSPDPVASTVARPERRSYVRRRGQSPFFGGTSRAGSSMRSSRARGYKPGQSALPVSRMDPGDSDSLLDSVLRDLKSVGTYPSSSRDEHGRGLGSRLSAGFSRMSLTSKLSDNSSRFKSASSLPHSRDFSRDESKLTGPAGEAGHRSWYRKERSFEDQASFYFAGDSRGSILEYETVRLQGVAGGDDAVTSATSPRLKLVDFKGKRPTSVDVHAGRRNQSGGSVAGDLAFL